MEVTAMDIVDAIGSTMDDLVEMGPEDPFTDLDIDSLSLVEAAVILSKKFGIRVDEFELADAGNASAVATLVANKVLLQPAR